MEKKLIKKKRNWAKAQLSSILSNPDLCGGCFTTEERHLHGTIIMLIKESLNRRNSNSEDLGIEVKQKDLPF